MIALFQFMMSSFQPSATSKSEVILDLNLLAWLFGSLNTNLLSDEEAMSQPSTPSPSPREPQPVSVVINPSMTDNTMECSQIY